MKEKNTLPSKGKSIFYLMLSLTTTLFVSSFIYFLVLHPSLDNQSTLDGLASVCMPLKD